MTVQDVANTLPGSASQKRFRRAFVRSFNLGRRPTLLEAQLINRACVLTYEAMHAMTDPDVTHTDRVRLDRCARMARADASRAIAAGRRDHPLAGNHAANIAAIFAGDA